MARKKSPVSSHGIRSLDLHGKTVEEAKILLLDCINDCLLDDIEQLRVIHGFGTGKIKHAVYNILSSIKHVKAFRAEMGNAGVTVVYF